MAKEAAGEMEKQKIIPVDKSMLENNGLAGKATAALGNLQSALPKNLDDVKNMKMPELPKEMPKMPSLPKDMPKMPKLPNPFGD